MQKFLSQREDYHLLHPRQVIIVVSGDYEKANMMPAGWHTILSSRPFLIGVAIAPRRYTHKLLMDFPFGTINLVDKSLQSLVEATGACSGRNVDKFEHFKVEKAKAANGSAYVKDIPAFLEVTCHDHFETGDHTFFVFEVTKTVLQKPFTPLFQIAGSNYQEFLTD